MFPDLGERRDEAGDANQPGVGKQSGHLGDAADVLLAVFGGEAQIPVQAVADVVSVQRVARDGVGHQVLLQGEADRRLAGTGQTYSFIR